MVNMTEQEHQLYKEYQEKAVSNVEVFRNEARVLFRRYNKDRRKFIKQLSSQGGSAYDVLITWRDELSPILTKLDQARDSKPFRSSIIKYLEVPEGDSQNAVDHIVNLRKEQIHDQFVKVFSKVLPEKTASELLSKDSREIVAMTDQYVRATLIQMVAKEQGVVFMDPHSSLFKRLRTAGKIRRERKRLNLRDKKRLAEIAARIEEIETQDNRLVGDIMKLQIDLVPTLAARANYEKRVAKMTKEDMVDAAARLEIFNDETRQIRSDIVEKIPGSLGMSLESVYSATKMTDKLLLRIFDLTNTQKNNLLISTKEHRELKQERDRIVTAQKERLAEQE